VPVYEPGHARFELVAQTYDNWRGLFHKAARRYSVPVQWLVGIASVETGPWSADRDEQASMVSYANAVGVMQIIPSTAKLLGYTREDMFDPARNIDAGAKLIGQLSRTIRSGLPAISGAYNSGKVCCTDPRCTPGCQNPYNVCTDGDYPGAALRYSNTAVLYLDMSAPLPIVAALSWGLLGVGVYGAYLGMAGKPAPQWMPRW